MNTEQTAALIALVRSGRDLIQEAMQAHIYDEANGEQPDADCGYKKHVEEVEALLAELWDGKTDSDGQPCAFRNHYVCEACDDTEWSDEWSCACNDKCPSCNAEIEPYQSDEWDFSLGKWSTK